MNFVKKSFELLQKDIAKYPEKRDCCLMVDNMSTRMQMYYSTQDTYIGFVNYSSIPTETRDTLATGVLVFLLVSARTHWIWPIGYFLADKRSSKTQTKRIQEVFEKAAKAGLPVWLVTADDTSVSIGMFMEIDCDFATSYDSIVTKFKRPIETYSVYAVLDSSHTFELARNAQAT